MTYRCGERQTPYNEKTISLQRQTSSLRWQVSRTRASQPELTCGSENLPRCNECSLSQPNRAWNSKLNLLFTIWTSSLRREPYSLLRVLSTSRAHYPEPARCSDNHTRCYESFLSQIAKHTFQSIHYYSLIILTRCSEIQSHCSECSQFAKQFYQQLKFFLNKINTLQVMLCCRHKLHLPLFRESPSFAP